MTKRWVFALRVHEEYNDFFLGYDFDGKGGRRGYATCEEVRDLVNEWCGFEETEVEVIVRSMNNKELSRRHWDLDIIITKEHTDLFYNVTEEQLIEQIKHNLYNVGLTFDFEREDGEIIEGNCEIVLKEFANEEPKKAKRSIWDSTCETSKGLPDNLKLCEEDLDKIFDKIRKELGV